MFCRPWATWRPISVPATRASWRGKILGGNFVAARYVDSCRYSKSAAVLLKFVKPVKPPLQEDNSSCYKNNCVSSPAVKGRYSPPKRWTDVTEVIISCLDVYDKYLTCQPAIGTIVSRLSCFISNVTCYGPSTIHIAKRAKHTNENDWPSAVEVYKRYNLLMLCCCAVYIDSAVLLGEGDSRIVKADSCSLKYLFS